MSRPSSCWRLPVLSLGVLGGRGCRVLGGEGSEGGLRDPVSHCSPSLRGSGHPGFPLSLVHQGESSGGGDSGSSAQGCGGACTTSSGVLQPHVRGDEGVRRVEVDYRPFHCEPLCGSLEVSYRDRSVGPPLGAEERLDGDSRSEGCLPSDSDLSTEPQVSKVHSRREGLAVQGSLLRAVHNASGFHSGYGSGFRNHASPGRPDVEVSGRLADNSLFSS